MNLSSGKIDKYEYLTGEEVLPSNQKQMIKQAKYTYSSLGKAFEKQTKTIEFNWTRTHKHLVHKRTLNHLAKMVVVVSSSAAVT